MPEQWKAEGYTNDLCITDVALKTIIKLCSSLREKSVATFCRTKDQNTYRVTVTIDEIED